MIGEKLRLVVPISQAGIRMRQPREMIRVVSRMAVRVVAQTASTLSGVERGVETPRTAVVMTGSPACGAVAHNRLVQMRIASHMRSATEATAADVADSTKVARAAVRAATLVRA